jgi:hypothetical protein
MNKNTNSLYVYIIMMFVEDEEGESEYALEPLGVYSTINKALKYVQQLEETTKDNENCIYEIFEYQMDSKPIALDWLKAYQEKAQTSINNMIISLMNQGLIDQLIGEDGEFYYRLTKLGEEIAQSDNPPKSLKEFQEKNKKDLDK